MADRLAPEEFVGERIGGRFVIERLIGAGPLSSAFRARDELLQRLVTVKLFHPSHADDAHVVHAQLELAKAVARLSHPNIVTVIDRGEHEGRPFVVLEYVRGENLQERIDRFAPLDAVEVAALATSIGRALAYSHAQGVVHGNLRPANVLVSEEREAKLVDFGGGSYVASLTGSDAWVAPELRHESPDAEPTEQHDIYALGVLLFVALTEQVPPMGADAAHVQLLRPDVSRRFAGVIARAVAARPDERYDSMHELANDLASVRAILERSNGNGKSAGPAVPAVAAADPDATGPMPLAEDHDDSPAGGAEGAKPRREVVRRPRQARARLVAWSMVLVPLAALVLVGILVSGERGSPTVTSRDRADGVQDPRPLEIQRAASFDPGGDGLEHEEEVRFLTDDDPETAWQTEGYEGSPNLADLKQGADKGVGFHVTLAGPAQVTAVQIETDLPGWTAQVYGADLPGKALSDWEPVSEPVPIELGKELEVDTDGRSYASYLVWITRLSIDDSGGDFRARVREVRVVGELDEAVADEAPDTAGGG